MRRYKKTVPVSNNQEERKQKLLKKLQQKVMEKKEKQLFQEQMFKEVFGDDTKESSEEHLEEIAGDFVVL